MQTITSDLSAAEAAHIIPRGRRGIDDVRNGFCACKIHHWAFDEGLISLLPDSRRIVVSNRIKQSLSTLSVGVLALNNSEVFWPADRDFPSQNFEWHYMNIFE